MSKIDFDSFINKVNGLKLLSAVGQVIDVSGLIIGSNGPKVSVGEVCHLTTREGKKLTAEVVGFKENKILLMTLADMSGISSGDIVEASGHTLTVPVSQNLLGRVLSGLGEPIDGKESLQSDVMSSIYSSSPNPLHRTRIKQSLGVGIKAIDACMTLGRGQRIGIFSGSGVGKSTLMGMMARNTEADVNVIALVGERGREVKDFIENSLGEEGLKRSVVVVATSDQPALIRIKCALTATSVAEYFRDQGKNVLLMMDSVTRFCMAQREIGLSIGEPPTTKGYPPSVFSMLPRLMERAGTSDKGSITGIYTVLVDADDFNEPIADACRSILDGHVILDRKIAAKNIWPAVDVLNSLSRVMPEVVTEEHLQANYKMRELLATYKEAEDLINIGAYVTGTNSRIDRAKDKHNDLLNYLRQKVSDNVAFKEDIAALISLVQ